MPKTQHAFPDQNITPAGWQSSHAMSQAADLLQDQSITIVTGGTIVQVPIIPQRLPRVLRARLLTGATAILIQEEVRVIRLLHTLHPIPTAVPVAEVSAVGHGVRVEVRLEVVPAVPGAEAGNHFFHA